MKLAELRYFDPVFNATKWKQGASYVISLSPLSIMTEVEPENGSGFGLEEVYRLIECNTIAVINDGPCLPDDYILIVDEDAAMTNKEFNHLASLICGASLYGKVLLCPYTRFH